MCSCLHPLHELRRSPPSLLRQPLALIALLAAVAATVPFDGIAVADVAIARTIPGLIGVALVVAYVAVKQGRFIISTQAQLWALLFAAAILGLELVRLMLADVVGYVGVPSLTRVASLYVSWLQPIVLFVLAVDLARDPRTPRIVLGAAVGAVAVLSLLMVARVPGVASVASGRWTVFDIGPNSLGFLIGFALVTALWWLVASTGKTTVGYVCGALVMGLLVVALLLTGSRGALLGTAAGVFVLVARTFDLRRGIVYVAVVTFVVVVFGSNLREVSEPIVGRFEAAIFGTSRGARDVIWTTSWDLVMEQPIVGYGLQASAAIGAVLSDGGNLAAHNTPLSLLLAFGVMGFGLWLAIVTSAFRRVWSIRHQPAGLLFLGLMAFLATSMVFNDYGKHKLVWLILAFAGHAHLWAPVAQDDAEPPARYRLLPGKRRPG